MLRSRLFIFCVALFATPALAKMVLVSGGYYTPIVGAGGKRKVAKFMIDEAAVTNESYAMFVRLHPEWTRGVAPSLFVDSRYLSQWKTEAGVGDEALRRSPVSNVSWFAAKAYCEAQNSQLPTVDQSEYLAQYGAVDGGVDVEEAILSWYSKPNQERLPNTMSTFKNKFGVWDVHGLVWEWAYDFNTTFVTGESRGDAALDKSMFCGGGAANSVSSKKYSAFMRFGFRSSLRANYSLDNLGFRCARGA